MVLDTGILDPGTTQTRLRNRQSLGPLQLSEALRGGEVDPVKELSLVFWEALKSKIQISRQLLALNFVRGVVSLHSDETHFFLITCVTVLLQNSDIDRPKTQGS